MKVINDINNKQLDITDKCLGCEIVNHNIKTQGGIIYETPNFIVVQDIETPIPGFMVITSKKHVRTILDLNKDEYYELMDLCYRVRESMMHIPDITDVTLIHKELAQHFHLWLFPRYEWMINNTDLGFGYGKLSDFSKIMEYTRQNLKTPENIKKINSYIEIIKKYIDDKYGD